MDGLRRFIQEDNHDAVKMGDILRHSVGNNIAKPRFDLEMYTEAAMSEDIDDFILRPEAFRAQRSDIDKVISDQRWGPPW